MYQKWVKRILDLVFAVILCPIAFAVVFVCYLAVKLESRGPGFFVQYRAGYRGKTFRIYKLRTMLTETEHDGHTLNDTERLTRVGKFLRMTSLDEFPQLFNVLKGEMSFIGPRPLFTKYLPLYSEKQMRRHEVLPGITGWAQVNGRNAISWEQKFEYDVWYVDHVCFLLDMKILFLTIINTLKRTGINNSSGEPVEEFHGTDVKS